MAPVLDFLLQVWNATNLTNTTVAYSTNSIDQQVVTRHMENGEEIGFGVFVTALTVTSSETYNFEVINDSTAALTSAPIVVSSTGPMTATDARINATTAGFQNGFFLPIPPGSLFKEWVGLGMVGTGTTNITVTAYLMNRGEWSQITIQPANYTP